MAVEVNNILSLWEELIRIVGIDQNTIEKSDWRFSTSNNGLTLPSTLKQAETFSKK